MNLGSFRLPLPFVRVVPQPPLYFLLFFYRLLFIGQRSANNFWGRIVALQKVHRKCEAPTQQGSMREASARKEKSTVNSRVTPAVQHIHGRPDQASRASKSNEIERAHHDSCLAAVHIHVESTGSCLISAMSRMQRDRPVARICVTHVWLSHASLLLPSSHLTCWPRHPRMHRQPLNAEALEKSRKAMLVRPLARPLACPSTITCRNTTCCGTIMRAVARGSGLRQ